MTVGAAPVEEKPRIGIPGRARMLRVHVTLSTQSWVSNFEQPVVYRAVPLMAIGALFYDRGMLPKKRSAPLGVDQAAGFINACLYELRRIGSSVRVVAVRTGHLSFPERHVRGAHELALSLQVALGTHLYLRSLVKEGGLVADLGKLKAVGGLLHDRVAVGANNSPASMGARLPVGLNSLLMALEAGVVLDLGGHRRIRTEHDKSAHALSSTFSHVLASRTVAGFTGLLFEIVAGNE